MENTIKMANRYGLNLKLTNIKDETDTAVIDFANEVSLEISGEITWATGGQGHVKMIGFKDPKEGTLKISTQVTTMQVMQLLAGGKLTDKGNKVSFKDDGKIAFKYYKIEGDTVWKDEEGVAYNEKVTVYKALVKPNYNVTYNGSGDPTSIDIEFELAVDKEGNFVDIERSEATTDITDAVIEPIADQVETGSAIEPTLTVTLDGNTLTAGTDYAVTYSDNTGVGTATATIVGINGYSGTKSVTFNIVSGS